MSYESYKSLIFGPLKSASEILTVLASDLKAVDETSILDQTLIIDKIADDDEKLRELAILCKDKAYSHPEWSKLSGRIRMIYIHRNTPQTFGGAIEAMKPVLGNAFYKFCIENAEALESMIDRNLDWQYDIFSVETQIRGYLTKVNDDKSISRLTETPQYKNMRIAAYLWYESDPLLKESSLRKINQMYLDLSEGRISPASPTQFNAGMKRPQLASCFLIPVEDSLGSLSKSWHDSAIISMTNGGIGIVYDSIRHSEIGNNGWSKGIVPWIKIENEVLSTVDQGGKRRGSGCMYLTCWHTDILEFVDLKEPFGKEELRAKDLFYGLMVSDLFMNRVKNNEMWTLFCPAKAGGLEKKCGREFEKAYLELERKVVEEGLCLSGTKRVMARDIWTHILISQLNTGMPFIVYKDAVNRKSNQQHMGTLRTSNLCVEVMEYVDKDNIASCNLASIPLSKFVKPKDTIHSTVWFDFDEFGAVVRRTIRNLGQTINRNYYAEEVPQIKYCNMRNRPLGIGVQDLAGCFAMLDICWDSQEAKELNEKIFRTMYYHGMDENVIMAEEFGAYETFAGSPASKGLFQFNLWAIEKFEKVMLEKHPDSKHTFNELLDIASRILLSPDELIDPPQVLLDSINSAIGYTNQQPLVIKLIIQKLKEFFGKLPYDDFDFDSLRHRMVSKGLYFSLLFAQMPTASSAQILGSNESIECYTQFLYARTVLSGQFVIVVDHLVKDLEDINLWNTDMLKHLLESQGSIQTFPTENMEDSQRLRFGYLKKKYRTAFEHSQRTFSDLYLNRAKYQCQSSSNNVFMKSPTLTSLNAYHFHMWKGGAKTGMYYLRQMVKSVPLNFSLESIQTGNRKDTLETTPVEDDVECLVCQS